MAIGAGVLILFPRTDTLSMTLQRHCDTPSAHPRYNGWANLSVLGGVQRTGPGEIGKKSKTIIDLDAKITMIGHNGRGNNFEG